MIRYLLTLIVAFQASLGLAYGACSQQFGFDTHNLLYQNGKLVGAVYRPKLGCSEALDEYTEYWILFEEFVRVGQYVDWRKVPTTVIPAKTPLKSLKAFTKLYKSRARNTYVTSFVTESDRPFTEITALHDNPISISQHEPDEMGLISQRGKAVGAHWRFGSEQTDGSYIEYWVLASDFVYPSHRTAAARKGMILKTAKNKVYTYDDFLSRVSFLDISKYIRVFCFESMIPFDQQS